MKNYKNEGLQRGEFAFHRDELLLFVQCKEVRLETICTQTTKMGGNMLFVCICAYAHTHTHLCASNSYKERKGGYQSERLGMEGYCRRLLMKC